MTEDASTLLVIEDHETTRAFLADNLSADGYAVLEAGSLAEGRRALEREFPDLVLCDVALPDGSGLDLVAEIRGADGIASRVDPATPVLLLTGRTGELDRIRGFERGADDYVCKPFSYGELRGRLEAVLRRAQRRQQDGRVRVGDLVIEPAGREVQVGDTRLELSQKEYALLLALARDPTRVRTKQELLRDVWGFRSKGSTRTLDSHACRLRRKLGVGGGRFVVNVWGVGYRLVDGAVVEAAVAS